MAGADELFGDSSSSDDTDDLLATAAAQSKPIAKKKPSAAKKKASTAKRGSKAAGNIKGIPDADDGLSDSDSDDDEGSPAAAKRGEPGLFDSSDEDDTPVKKKKLGSKKKAGGKKRGGNSNGGKAKPPKKDTRSKAERMAALAKKRKGGDQGGEPSRSSKRAKKAAGADGSGSKGGGGGDDDGYESAGSVDSAAFQRTQEDDDFIDKDDQDGLQELYADQKLSDVEDMESDDEGAAKANRGSGRGRKSGGAGVDKITLSDDEGGEGANASAALKAVVKRMQRKKKERKNVTELEDEAARLVNRMREAADEDEACVKERRPATNKLKMLGEVLDVLTRLEMLRPLLNAELLLQCKRWVQPLPNKKLGNVTLRRDVLDAVSKLPSAKTTDDPGISSSDLKNSGFGKVVMLLYRHPDEVPDVKKMCHGMIEAWSRPIFRKSGNMADLKHAQEARRFNQSAASASAAPAARAEARPAAARGRTEDDLAAIISGGSKNTSGAGNNRVRVPYSKGFQYSIRPEGKSGQVGDMRNLVSAKAARGPKADEGRRDKLSKRMVERNRKRNKSGERSANISIEGRVAK